MNFLKTTKTLHRLLFAVFLLSFIGILVLFHTQNDKKIYLGFDKFYLSNVDTVQMGGKSNINFNSVPDSILAVSFTGDSISWKLKEPYYVKINNVNPNAYPVNPDSRFSVNGVPLAIPSHIWEPELNCVDNLQSHIKKQKDYISLDSIFGNRNIKSLLYRKYDLHAAYDILVMSFQVILLDTLLIVDGHSYSDSGKVTKDTGIKVQLYEAKKANTVSEGDSTASRFVSLAYKPNNYRNNHVLLKQVKEGQFTCNFSKKNSVVIDFGIADSIARNYNSEQKKIYLNFSENLRGSNHIYLPAFSASFDKKIFYLDYNDFDDLKLVSQGDEEYEISNYLFSKNPILLDNGNYKLEILVSKNPHLSALLVILLLWIQSLISIFYIHGKRKLFSISNFVHYSVCVFLSLKVIIAYSLGFNSPFFIHIYYSVLGSVFLLQFIYYYIIIRVNGIDRKRKIWFGISNIFSILALYYILGVFPFFRDYSHKYLSLSGDYLNDTFFFIPLILGLIGLFFIVHDALSMIPQDNYITQKFYDIGRTTLVKYIRRTPLIKSIRRLARRLLVKKYKAFTPKRRGIGFQFLVGILLGILSLFIIVFAKTAYEPFVTTGSILLIGYLFFTFIDPSISWKEWYKFYLIRPVIVLAFFIFTSLAIANDLGFLIVLLSFSVSVVIMFIYLKEYLNKKWIFALLILLLIISSFGVFAITGFEDDQNYRTDRGSRRLSAFVDFDTNREKGFRVSEQDNEFFAIMGKYSKSFSEIPNSELSTDMPFFHKDISEVKYPTVINDLSTITTLVRPYGLLITLLLLSFWFTGIGKVHLDIFNNRFDEDNTTPLTFRKIIKFLAISVLVFEGAYLFLSYTSLVPFTGRLIYGLGVDSIGEHITFILLMVLIGLETRGNVLARPNSSY